MHQEKFSSGDILVFGVFNIEKHKTSLVYPKKRNNFLRKSNQIKKNDCSSS